jgi:hypothetical protein
MRKTVPAIVAMCLLMMAPTLANAEPPQRHQLSYTERFSTSDICGFRTTFTWVGTGYGIVFTDAAGDFVRQTDRIRETLTVTSAGGKVSGKDAYAITERADGTFTRVGLWFHLMGEGGGTVLRDVGRLEMRDGEIVMSAGQHDWLNGDFDALCAALSG